jgi:hypothetical protein
MHELSKERLAILEDAALENDKVVVSSYELLELVRAYNHHKRVLPLHQKIAEACKELGF